MSLSPNNLFPFGTHIYREPHQDQDELRDDLPILKRLGFNMVKIQESWAIDEPCEGSYNFTRIERLIAQARELKLGVYLGLTMEQAPAWLWRKYPDAYMVDSHGHPHNDSSQYCLPSDGKPGPCWDHIGAREAGERFVATLARQLGRFDNIWTWNTWQEISFWPNDAGVLGFCYCSHTLARFRLWLQEKYSSLTKLNQTWYTGYGDWEEIEPPRRFGSTPSFIDWRYFMNDVYIVRALTWKTQALKANDPGKRPVFSHLPGPVSGSGAAWRWARVGDFFGTSIYPAWTPFDSWDDEDARPKEQHTTLIQEVWQGIMFRIDFARSATGRGRAFWAAEFQGGPINTYLHIGRTPTAADIRRWTLAALAAGVQGISFWNHRAERFWLEGNGYGLLDPQGVTSERIEEASRLAQAINFAPEIFAQGHAPQAQVALLVNEDLYHFYQATDSNTSELFAYNLRGHYARLWQLGIPVDFVEAAEVTYGTLTNYKVAILSMPLALDPTYLVHLRAFVEQGGILISEACPGRFDKYGFCPRTQMAQGAEELFGTRHKHVRVVQEPNFGQRWTPKERGWGEFAPPTLFHGVDICKNSVLQANFYVQTLVPTTGKTILQAGEEVVGVIHEVGTGKAILLGTFTGISATAYKHEASNQFMKELLLMFGVVPDLCGSLLRRRRILHKHEAWFFINPRKQEVRECVSLGNYEYVRNLLVNEHVEQKDGSLLITVPVASIICIIVTQKE